MSIPGFPSRPRFSALILHKTEDRIRSGRAMLDYELTTATDRFALRAVVEDNQVVAESPGVEALCREIDALGDQPSIQAWLVAVLRAEGTRWAADPRWRLGEDLSRRNRLLEGSVMRRQTVPGGGALLSVLFHKPPRPAR